MLLPFLPLDVSGWLLVLLNKIMNNQEYNGWYNYETWAVKLWMDNERGTASYWQEQTEYLLSDEGQQAHSSRYNNDRITFKPEEIARLALMEQLKEEHEEANPLEETATVFTDLLRGALAEVNWREIAQHLIDDANNEKEYQASQAKKTK